MPIWSKRNRNTDGLNDILIDIESNSRIIFEKKFTGLLNQHAKTAQQYIEEMLKSASLSVSELDEKEEKLSVKLNMFKQRLNVNSNVLKNI